MALLELNVKRVMGIDPQARGLCSVDVEMDDTQIFVAIDMLLDAGGPEKRAQRLAQLAENELNGMHA